LFSNMFILSQPHFDFWMSVGTQAAGFGTH